jgi:hypothetical protein
VDRPCPRLAEIIRICGLGELPVIRAEAPGKSESLANKFVRAESAIERYRDAFEGGDLDSGATVWRPDRAVIAVATVVISELAAEAPRAPDTARSTRSPTASIRHIELAHPWFARRAVQWS